VRRRLRALLGSERGYTLVELLSVMGILGSVMAGVTAMLVSGTKAEHEMNRRFQAQTQARLALDQLRREVHCATGVAESGTTATIGGLTYYSVATLTIPSACPTAAGQTQITWCTVANGSSYRIWRYAGAACSGTGRLVAEHVTLRTPFDFVASSVSSLSKLSIRIEVNVRPTQTQSTYKLTDDIVLRNSTRT
jgi:prepilin-type N-terminal cleavage/methylation domain-containing protein